MYKIVICKNEICILYLLYYISSIIQPLTLQSVILLELF